MPPLWFNVVTLSTGIAYASAQPGWISSASRVPTLEFALAYEAIYGKPVRELFAGLYEQIAPEVSARAKILSYRKNGSPDPKRQQALSELALRHKKLVA